MANTGWGSSILPSKLESIPSSKPLPIPSRRVKISFTINGKEYASEQNFSIVAPGTIHFNLGTATIAGSSASGSSGCASTCGSSCSGCSGPNPPGGGS